MSGVTVRDAAARLLAAHTLFDGFGYDHDRPHKCYADGCDWSVQFETNPDQPHAAHVADVLAAAGLLRPDTTVDDREALRDVLRSFALLVSDGPSSPPLEVVDARVGDVLAVILAAGFARPRGPVTGADPDAPDEAEAWDEGFTAGAEWIPSGPSGIPSDPPLNPYRTPWEPGRPRGPVTETPAVTPEQACTGAGSCPAPSHVHGCYADSGSCDDPDDHAGIEVRASDGLTDTERAELAQRYAEGPARPRTAEEITATRSRLSESFDRVTGAINEVFNAVGPPPGSKPPAPGVTYQKADPADRLFAGDYQAATAAILAAGFRPHGPVTEQFILEIEWAEGVDLPTRVGPFTSGAEARRWGHLNIPNGTWSIEPIAHPYSKAGDPT